MGKYFKSCIVLLCFICAHSTVIAQNSDSIKFVVTMDYARGIADGYLYRQPNLEDSVYCKQHQSLIHARPNDRNFHEYYTLANKLYNIGRFTEAIPMLNAIVASKMWQYNYNYHDELNGKADTTVKLPGYGGFSVNYKNGACIYLMKIYLEQGQFKTALKYLNLAEDKYPEDYFCGTMYNWYRQEMDEYYAHCYYGLGMYDTIIVKYIHHYSSWLFKKDLLMQSIKNRYTAQEIQQHLLVAENSIDCKTDSFYSQAYTIRNYRTPLADTTYINYRRGHATFTLFNQTVEMSYPGATEGAIHDKEAFLKEFKSSPFYKDLWNAWNAQN